MLQPTKSIDVWKSGLKDEKKMRANGKGVRMKTIFGYTRLGG